MNLPNKISIFRICCMPLVVLLFLLPIPDGIGIFCALGVYAIGSLSDFVDGHIARKYHLITDFGKFIDQVADKAMSTAALVLACLSGAIFWNWVSILLLIVIVVRDILVAGVRQIAAAKGVVIGAGWTGKVKSNFIDFGDGILIFYVGLCAALPNGAATKVGTTDISFVAYIGLGLVVIGAILSVISGIEYVVKAAPMLKETPKESKNEKNPKDD